MGGRGSRRMFLSACGLRSPGLGFDGGRERERRSYHANIFADGSGQNRSGYVGSRREQISGVRRFGCDARCSLLSEVSASAFFENSREDGGCEVETCHGNNHATGGRGEDTLRCIQKPIRNSKGEIPASSFHGKS